MKEEEYAISEEEHKKLSALVEKAKRLLKSKTKKDENLSLGTLDYLKKYRIDT